MMRRSQLMSFGKHSLAILCLASLCACSFMWNYKECSENKDCAEGGLVCEKGYCVRGETVDSESDRNTDNNTLDVLNDECTRVYGFDSDKEALSEDSILLGALLPYTGDLGIKGPKTEEGLKLAVDEINLADGILGKKVGVLLCDSGTDPAQAERALKHMVALGRIQAVIGPLASDVVIQSFSNVALDAEILMISPAATAPQISDLQDNDLLWRTVPSDTYQGQAIATFLRENMEYKKIAVVNRNDVYGNGLRDYIIEHLCESFPCTDKNSFYAGVYNRETLATEQSQIVIELSEFEPDITLLISYYDDGVSFLETAEKNNLNNFFATDSLQSDDLASLSLSADMLCRLKGTRPASSNETIRRSFELRFEGKYGAPGSYSAHAYDAVFLLAYAYAAAAAHTDRPTGLDIAAGLRRTVEGETVNAGTVNWSKTMQTLSSDPDMTINYEGASGSLDFDENGESPADIEGWALDLENGRTLSVGVILSEKGTVFTDPFNEISGQGEECTKIRGIECTNSTHCIEGDYCDLTLEPPRCKAPPTGQGVACEQMSDCASYDADYCETLVSFSCLVQNCDPVLDNCSEGYHCCDFTWMGMGLPALCIDEELSGGVCTTAFYPCESSADCLEGDYCDLTMESPSCLDAPSGQGQPCKTAEDCGGFKADYCESMVSSTCLMQNCDKNLNNCSPGYQCCDFTQMGLELPALCVDVTLSGGHCACNTTDDCKDGDFCDTTFDTPVCYSPPTGQGESCADSRDCEAFEANYCDVDITSTCLRSDCSVEENNCSPGYRCCDFADRGLPALCVDEAVYETECKASK